jgi:uncharacterized protein YndB with AHSA1/START domain
MPISPVRVEIHVPLSPEEAFRLFTDGFGSWWPQAYTWSQDALVAIMIDAQAGGRCTETGPEGFTCDFGRVLEADPGRRIKLLWQISPRREPVPDPSKASEIDILFKAEAGGTRVVLVHDGFDRHGDGATGYADAMGSPQGWPMILGAFAKAA